jgi:hypothetical protein
VTEMKAAQSGLAVYAEAVLRQHGVKSCRVRWPSNDVLTIEVDPTRRDQVARLLPIIQQRAGKNVVIEMHELTSSRAEVTAVDVPFDE